MKFAWLLAFAPMIAAAAPVPDKPPVPHVDINAMEQSVAEITALAECMSLPPAGPGAGPAGNHPGDCDCAIDRFVAERGAGALEGLGNDAKPLQPYLTACHDERVPATGASQARGAKPADTVTYPPPNDEWPRGGRLRGYGSWLEARGIPVWLGVFGPLVLAVAIGWWLAGGRRRRNDLIAPPRWMQQGGAKPPSGRPEMPERPDDPAA